MAQGQQAHSLIAESIFKQAKKAVIPFIVSGYPNIEATKELLFLFEKMGAAAVELGIPFSDPLADGAVIQQASKKALDSGMNLDIIFNMLNEVKGNLTVPIILFTYINPVVKVGAENFVKRAADAGVAGLIIPDLPIEESDEIRTCCVKFGIDLIMLVAPLSSDERIERIAKVSQGFIYLVSSTGVTGVRDTFSDVLPGILEKIRKYSDIPVAVGFGVSKPEHITAISEIGADGAIIGSALIKLINEHGSNIEILKPKMTEYLSSMMQV